MNKERFIQIADEIAEHKDCFDMCNGRPVDVSCGTAGCIAGFIKPKINLHMPMFNDCAEWLGISEDQADDIFYGNNIWMRYHEELGLPLFPGTYEDDPSWVRLTDIKAEHAEALLRGLADGTFTF